MSSKKNNALSESRGGSKSQVQ